MPIGSLDRWPEDYERGRPGWPREAVDVAALPPTATVLELGAGTGKLTRLLVAAFDRVVALEPAEPMRRLLATQCPEAETVTGTAEDIPLADASVDAVFAAEAFHRFDKVRALGEIVRVLRPGGALVLLWNLPAGPTDPPIAALEQFLAERGPSPGDVDYDPLDLRGAGFSFSRRGACGRRVVVRAAAGRAAGESANHRPGRPAGVLRLDGMARRPSGR